MPWLLEMTLLVSSFMLVPHLYIGWRAERLLKKQSGKLYPRLILYFFLLSFYCLPAVGLLYHWLWGDPDMLSLWQPMSYWFWLGLVFSFQFLTWLIILDFVKLLARFISNLKRGRIEKYYRRAFYALAIVLFMFTAAKMIYDTRKIQVENITCEIAELSPALQDFRIVHITDIQADEYTGRPEIARYIEKVNALNPDLVVFTGDLISYGTDFIAMAAEELAKVEAPYGTYAVVGDHDYWADVSHFEKEYAKYDIKLLQDQNKIIPVGQDNLLLTGITEVYSKQVPGDSLDALTNEHVSMSLRILASHQATEKVINQAKTSGYELLLAGHTHGGQLRVPFMFTTFSAAEQDTPYLSGTYRFDDLLMNVDNGLGFTLAPVRYNAPPTISVINLKSASQ
ncbi:MAG: metallophosphoesterase [Balneolaceae bacterium]|nr:metallophosphoesterase [Balneolaceae bacterium]